MLSSVFFVNLIRQLICFASIYAHHLNHKKHSLMIKVMHLCAIKQRSYADFA
ncbi:hypothetical protein GARC_0868 [Paraglaciecola arctica BSs20135]|uniref:Uncharacterized protein n=1 Tax=Paraglaciecola arctica BSs20135 TaxID=493475 RepID=K6XB64_9ALTE|nr:hypothetical protein GARC_0868 [Paraglaciecola arctica BSs20135]